MQAIFFSRGHGRAESHITLKEQYVPSLSQVKYLGAIFDRRNTNRNFMEMVNEIQKGSDKTDNISVPSPSQHQFLILKKMAVNSS
jgi:hypothetical protein